MNPFFEEVRKRFLHELIQIMGSEQETGLLRRDMSLEFLAESTLSTIEGVAKRFLINNSVNPRLLAAQMSDMYINGIKA